MDVQMDAQGIGEQGCGLLCLFEYLISHLFLVVCIATFVNGRRREVVAICKHILVKVNSVSISLSIKSILTRIRPRRF